MKIIILSFLVLILLSSCVKQELVGVVDIDKSNAKKITEIDENKINNEKYFAIIPHHNLVDNNIDEFYKNLKEKYKTFDNIVIISPNHFDNKNFSIEQDSKICYNSSLNCLNFKGFVSNFGFENNINSFEKVEDYLLTKEHGIGNNFKFINKYFSDSNNYFLLLKINTKKDEILEKYIDFLNKYSFSGKTLFISSVDFSHHVNEKVAIFHDLKTLDYLKTGNISNLEVDCPNCLYLIKDLSTQNNKNYFNLYNRSSADSYLNINSNYDNTSHVYGEFLSEKNNDNFEKSFSGKYIESKFSSGIIDDNYIYGMSFGDVHFTRGLSYFVESGKKEIYDYFKCFYSNSDINKSPNLWHNRMFYSFDLVGINLETSIGNENQCTLSNKEIVFQTNPEYLKYFKNVGINLYNLANNHSYDCGEIGYNATKNYLKENNLNYFGDGRREESEIFKTEINGIKVAYLGFNDIGKQINIIEKSSKIEELTKEGYLVIINIHWGFEYELKHNKRQEIIAKTFIDSGAKLIIGHHPHVIQDSEVYKGVPIFYSLGNFIFDQPFEETLKGYGLVYAINKNGIKYNLLEFERNSVFYDINCKTLK